MIRNIIWDVDGTLFDTYPAIAGAFRAALNDLGKDASLERITGLARISLGHCVTTLAEECRQCEEDVGRTFEEHYDHARPEEQPPFPGVVAVCEWIRARGGKNLIVTHRERRSANELLAAHGMSGYFAGCLGREDGYPKKPDPAAFDALLRMQDLLRGETMAVGDRDIDVLAGKAAGLSTCLFGHDADGASPDLTIGSFDELLRYLATKD